MVSIDGNVSAQTGDEANACGPPINVGPARLDIPLPEARNSLTSRLEHR